MEKSKDKDVLNFFMDDSPWLTPKDVKQKTPKKQPEENIIKSQKAETRQDEEKTIQKEGPVVQVRRIRENNYQDNTENEDIVFGEVDYAILKSVTYGFKTIKEISNALQIRSPVVEKHIYKLIKDGFIKYFQFCVITSKGKNVIEEFETGNPEEVWRPIIEFIEIVIENRKERNIKIQKSIDLILVVSVIILIILIIYFGVL
ncbi:MAG: hypothetical protein FIB07_02915 [Candidatus Methanoperedens sp.]|nr:hypothetical protein [Candidatus Methanoperedens sp.]